MICCGRLRPEKLTGFTSAVCGRSAARSATCTLFFKRLMQHGVQVTAMEYSLRDRVNMFSAGSSCRTLCDPKEAATAVVIFSRRRTVPMAQYETSMSFCCHDSKTTTCWGPLRPRGLCRRILQKEEVRDYRNTKKAVDCPLYGRRICSLKKESAKLRA